MRLRVGHQFSQFGARLVDYYSLLLGPGVISTINEPRGAFTCPSSTLTVLANFDLFRGLYSLIWGPEENSIVVELQGALTCRSSKLVVWGPFRGLLLTAFGSRSDFHD